MDALAIGHAPEFHVEIRIRNNRLRSARKARGLSQAALAVAAGVGLPAINKLEVLRLSPMTKRGEWRKPVLALAAFFGVEPVTLFPVSLLDIEKPVSATTATAAEVQMLSSGEPLAIAGPDEGYDGIELHNEIVSALDVLTEQERITVELWFGLNGDRPLSAKEIGQRLGVSRARVSHLVSRATEKLKKKAMAGKNGLAFFADIEIAPKPPVMPHYLATTVATTVALNGLVDERPVEPWADVRAERAAGGRCLLVHEKRPGLWLLCRKRVRQGDTCKH